MFSQPGGLWAWAKSVSLHRGAGWIGLLSLFLQKLGKVHNHKRSASLKLLEEAFGELGRIIPVLLLDEARNYSMSALEDIRMLLGLNLPEQPAFALILVGDPYLLARQVGAGHP